MLVLIVGCSSSPDFFYLQDVVVVDKQRRHVAISGKTTGIKIFHFFLKSQKRWTSPSIPPPSHTRIRLRRRRRLSSVSSKSRGRRGRVRRRRKIRADVFHRRRRRRRRLTLLLGIAKIWRSLMRMMMMQLSVGWDLCLFIIRMNTIFPTNVNRLFSTTATIPV